MGNKAWGRDQGIWNNFFILSLVIICGILFFNPVQAEEIPADTQSAEEETTGDPDSNEEGEENEDGSDNDTEAEESETQDDENDGQDESEEDKSEEDEDGEEGNEDDETAEEDPAPEETPEYPTTTINIQIETFDATLYDDTFVVTACSNTEHGTEYTLNIWCAIEQIGEEQGWSILDTWGAYGVTYDINEYKGNDFSDGMWWGWYSELYPGMTGVDAHILSEDEKILLVYGVEPSKIIVNNIEPELNTTTTIEFQKFDWGIFDWAPNPSSTFVINNEEIFDEDGIYELEITTTTPYEIYGMKDGFLDSEIITISPTSTSEELDTGDTGGTGGTTGNITPPENDDPLISQSEIDYAVSKILDYLKSQQDETGKILDGNMTDWAIMSFGADAQYADDIKQENGKSLLEYEKSYDLDADSDMSDCATYPRHILALLSAGVSVEDDAIQGLKDKTLNTCYENNLYGLNGINDDVFALMALLAIDIDPTENIIIDIVSTTLSWQLENGAFSWPDWYDPTQKVAGDDITGASINALQYAKEKGAQVEDSILLNAKTYLKTTQQSDGGWGYGSSDIMTTSWVLMGINALDESQEDWSTSTGKNPWYPLVNNVNDEGYYESVWAPGTVDWFAMKHAVPALKGASWPIVLDPIVEDFSDGATFTYGSGGGTYIPPVEDTATTTEDITTTTLDIVTSTEYIATTTEDIIESNEDPEKIIEEIKIEEIEKPVIIVPPAPVVYNAPQVEVRGEKIEIKDEIKTEEIEESTDAEALADKADKEEKNGPNPLPALIIIGGMGLLYGAWRLVKILI